jgi:hypothetical protein
VEGEVDSLTVSRDGEWLLVIYDYQAPSGSPDIEQMQDQTAFGIFHILTRKWTRKEPRRRYSQSAPRVRPRWTFA